MKQNLSMDFNLGASNKTLKVAISLVKLPKDSAP